jgi:hypothetical protein
MLQSTAKTRRAGRNKNATASDAAKTIREAPAEGKTFPVIQTSLVLGPPA